VAVGQAVNGALRKAILASSGSPRVRRFADRHGLRLGASRFVAGEDLDACVVVLRRLNEQGLHANTTLLGEDVLEGAEARGVAEEYLAILTRVNEEALKANVALKLTHLGLGIDEELAFENVRRVVEHAAELGNFIRIDMEYSALVDPTLRIYRRLREAGLDNVGTVLQSYLYRTPDDLESLLPLAPNLRLVKGAYLEPESVAYPKKDDVDAAYLRLVERSLTGGGYTAIATHDERMIEHALAFAEQEGNAFVIGNGVNKPKGFLDYTKVAEASWSWGNIGYKVTGVSGAFAASNATSPIIAWSAAARRP